MKKAILLLEDGKSFDGILIGKEGTFLGEIAFNTTMTGYQEVFTDPSYYNQIIIMNNVHIGNYGISDFENESDGIKISALVCNKFSNYFSRKGESIISINKYLIDNNIGGISNIDTRELVRYIRNKGAMNAIISSEILNTDELMKKLIIFPSMSGLELSSKVSTNNIYTVNDKGIYTICLIDYGVKANIINSLVKRDCKVIVFPSKSDFETITSYNPDGIMLSNGPGDPSVMKSEIKTIERLIDVGIPLFGICLGHQLIALSQNLYTKKMHIGHRGANHPIKNIITGKCEITSQNHGFVVDEKSVEKNKYVNITHIHLNDNTIAGLEYIDKPIFSVQYHPESNPGPNDSKYLFDNFINLINAKKQKNKKIK